MRLRRATLDDLGVLVRHRRGMWEAMDGEHAAGLDEADAVYRRWARARLRSGRLVGWVAEERRMPVASGCVWLQPVQPMPGQPGGLRPYLLSMFTEPHARGRGHAERVVRAAMDWCRAEGHARLVLHAAPLARPLYGRLGFERGWEMRIALTPKAPRRARRGASPR